MSSLIHRLTPPKVETRARNLLSLLMLKTRRLIGRIQARRLPLLAVALPVIIRTIPELLAGPYPLGFDTLWVYAPFVRDVENNGFAAAMLELGSRRSAPLMYLLIAIVASLSRAEPFLVVKGAAPLLHGFLVFSMYYLAKRGLGWDNKRCLLIILVSTLYFVPLRFSWDMYKNSLGYGLLILALAHLRKSSTSRERWSFFLLAGLSILASELTAVLLGAIMGLIFLQDLVRRRRWNLAALATGVTAFAAILIYLRLMFPVSAPASPLAPIPRMTSFPYNYIGSAVDIYNYPGLGDVYVTVLFLSGMILAPLLPFALLGLRRDRLVCTWTFALVVGAFSLLVVPFAAFPLWHRWLFMLTFPALIFTVRGLSRFGRKSVLAFLLVIVLLSTSFMVLLPANAFPYYSNPYTLPYIPSSMVQNTVPLEDSPDIIKALQWLNEMRFEESVLLAHISFVGWAKLYSNIPSIYGFVDADQVNDGNFSAFRHVFLVYWAPTKGWFEASLLPEGTVEIHRSGNIALFELSTPDISPVNSAAS